MHGSENVKLFLEFLDPAEGNNKLYRRFGHSTSVYTPSVYMPSVYTPSVYTPSVFTPSVYTPSV
jgi:hypothetical protein